MIDNKGGKMIKNSKSGRYVFGASVNIPKKLNMPDAIELLDKEINRIRHEMLEELAKKHGVKLKFSH